MRKTNLAKVQETKAVKNGAAEMKVVTSTTEKENGNGAETTAEHPDTAANVDLPKPTEAAPETTDQPGEQPTGTTAQNGKAEKTKLELKQQVIVRNVDSTVKIVEELHRRTVQRQNLLETIARLEAFEIERAEDKDHEADNYYHGCQIEIRDDDNNKFTTRNANLIQRIAVYVKELCVERLAEIEAGIILPAS